ncbi:MAG: 5-methyltetrahydropteroyltriglutamate--homocysteine S-methyltransferase, partial [Actinobacteria bacterium]|nr:5-methyltetrahydropteroyltriglutamate--homocysteine S-methyltransferase [Actinomycetota bacterium]NIV88129.1 5-methyltetrahydropteroyltriglutamate--homocysteine S-methyltransferase [Actinomycetota bacterium]NIX51434.1 5-methyltetrahydropteroyltriglutamate--homocysteine S-methyltransferase [Actinomycetota bacterium]
MVTDGEFRRAWWHFDFLAGLEGVEWVETDQSIPFRGAVTKLEGVGVTGRVDFGDHVMLDHFRYLDGVSSVTAKMTIPSPSVLHFRGGRQSISRDV